MKLAASNVDLRGTGTGATVGTVVFEPAAVAVVVAEVTVVLGRGA